MSDVVTPLSQARKSGWFARNWPWVIVFAVAMSFILCCGFVGSMFFVGMRLFKSTDVYVQTMSHVRANQQVIDALGTPVDEGFFVQGNVEVSTVNAAQSGSAVLSIPISGPKGAAIVNSRAVLVDGQWEFTALHVTLDETGQTIHLLQNKP